MPVWSSCRLIILVCKFHCKLLQGLKMRSSTDTNQLTNAFVGLANNKPDYLTGFKDEQTINK